MALDLFVASSRITSPTTDFSNPSLETRMSLPTESYPQTTRSAMQKALALPEMLENILRNLSFDELNRVRPVSRDWRDVMESWPSLRRTRFLEPDPAADARLLYAWQFVDFSLPRFSFRPHGISDLSLLSANVVTRVVQVHPRLIARWPANLTEATQMEVKFPNLHVLMSLPAGGEWERALLMQPPCKRIIITVSGELLDHDYQIEVQNENGVRVGQVVRQLREEVPAIPDIAPPKHRTQAALRRRREIQVTGVVAGVICSRDGIVHQARLLEEQDKTREENQAKRRRAEEVRTSKKGAKRRREA